MPGHAARHELMVAIRAENAVSVNERVQDQNARVAAICWDNGPISRERVEIEHTDVVPGHVVHHQISIVQKNFGGSVRYDGPDRPGEMKTLPV